jgi:rSAM-associated Gly-rich repeat protein
MAANSGWDARNSSSPELPAQNACEKASEGRVTLRQRYLKILSAIAPVGAVGASLLLGSVASGAAKEDPARLQPRADGRPPVADRLAAIRQAVNDITGDGGTQGGERLAWWGNWRNGGGAGAWRNSGGGAGVWRNGGWGPPGGWRNGPGWRNGGWPNFWRNW